MSRIVAALSLPTAAFFAVLVIASAFLGGYLTGQAYTRAEAIEAGAGNYTADGRDWEWRRP